ncbi:MAG: hypothetical protein DAHOPDDO_00602 [Ignavibacteriaceae bacterium]|nr:hypothetical protein [Ignavibacteriaceae bacterium]
MREIGHIKWFGGYKPTGEYDENDYMEKYKEINYGFIKPISGEDLFVHKNDVISSTLGLNEGVLVTFGIYFDEKKNKNRAVKVKRINDEEDNELIKKLAFSNSSTYWTQALPVYLDRINFEDATKILFEKLNDIDHSRTKSSFVSNLPFKFLSKFNELRPLLSGSHRFHICLRMFREFGNDQKGKVEILEEAIDSLKEDSTMRIFLIRDIPKEYLIKYQHLREKLNDSEYFDLCLEILESELNEGNVYDTILNEIVNYCSDSGGSYYWDKLPEKILVKHSELRSNLSPKKRFEICMILIDKNTSINAVDKVLVKEAIDCIQDITWDKEEYWEQIPKKCYENEFEFRALLPLSMFMDILLTKYKSGDIAKEECALEIRDRVIKAIKDDEYSFNIESAINLLPNDLLLSKEIFEVIPDRIKIRKLIDTMEPDNDVAIKNIIMIIESYQSNEKEELLNIIPTDLYLREKNLWNLLLPLRKIEILPLGEQSLTDIWFELNHQEKIFLIYRCLKENVDLNHLIQVSINQTGDIENPQVVLLLILLQSLTNPNNKLEYFKLFHSGIQNVIIEKAWNLNEEIDLEPLLPNCRPNLVKYCEARAWPTDEDQAEGHGRLSRVFCPRGKRECSLNFRSNYSAFTAFGSTSLSGARILPDTNLSWKDWSLIEVLKVMNITPSLPDLSNSLEYVPRLSGWVNRLNEIRERMKCSVCQSPLIANQQYAKNLARYNSTIASCSQGMPHDYNIYFNHCWACREIIDSRESKIQVENYYICLYCGSGPQQSLKYTQGSICPKCGHFNIIETNDRDRKCNDCGHLFRIPPKHNLTGKTYNR